MLRATPPTPPPPKTVGSTSCVCRKLNIKAASLASQFRLDPEYYKVLLIVVPAGGDGQRRGATVCAFTVGVLAQARLPCAIELRLAIRS
jgi:hypothetical protein